MVWPFNAKRVPHPFKNVHHEPGAKMLRDKPAQLQAALQEHVIGQRITKVEFVRNVDEQSSDELGFSVDNIDLIISLENNVEYIARLVVPSLSTVSRGEALSHLHPGDPSYTTPS